MALWGNNDNVSYKYDGLDGTVTVDYDTLEVQGTGTTFGSPGYAKTGDIIRIGFRGTGGTYFGDAAIVGIASTTSITIASTDGLSGAAIAATSYWISELPQYTTLNPLYSEDSTFNKETSSFQTYFTGASEGYTGTACSNIGILGTFGNEYYNHVADRIGPDYQGNNGVKLSNDGNQIGIQAIGYGYANAGAGSGVGSDRVYVGILDFPGLTTTRADTPVPSSYQDGGNFYAITSIGATYIGLGQTISDAVTIGDPIKVNNDNITWLSEDVGAGIDTGDSLVFMTYRGGHDRYVYGVSGAGVTAGLSTTTGGTSSDGIYSTSAGWVGVTTYVDTDGNYRVKKEVLVAMSGITTGPAGLAGTAGAAYPPTYA